MFDLLKNDRRRMVMALLADEVESVTIGDVARTIAATEAEETPAPEKVYKSVYVSLQQTHLPKLAENGVIEYNRSTGTVAPGPNLDDVLVYVEPTGVSDIWQSEELILGLVGLVVTLAAVVGVPLVSALAAEVWAVFFFTAIICLNAYRLLAQ
ncbi:hypothetical protein AUR64_01900 [Haloprofundus marisrubri]|uniref:DUF7344 domain-containing protein n=1 Tax=Haloprofundus marisrubri TaxID=1514971 RepID=A0A0W1R3F9_9EURY|nr:hypothetical protein AUR64_01900 [Haloprofundus marisrubri]